jgi:hypothetical protein
MFQEIDAPFIRRYDLMPERFTAQNEIHERQLINGKTDVEWIKDEMRRSLLCRVSVDIWTKREMETDT